VQHSDDREGSGQGCVYESQMSRQKTEKISRCIPATHSIGTTAEDLGQTANSDIGIWKSLDIYEVPDRVIDDQQKVVFVRQGAETRNIG